MTTIKLFADGATAWVEVNGEITAGAVGIPVEIHCDSEWDDLIKTQVAMTALKRVPIVGVTNVGYVPWELLKEGLHLYVGLEGRSQDGEIIIPTIWADCGKIRAAADGSHTAKPTPNEIEQLLLLMGDRLSVEDTETVVPDMDDFRDLERRATAADITEKRIAEIEEKANKKLGDVLDSIPDDYTQLSESVTEISTRTDMLPIALDYERTGQDFDFTKARNNKAIKSEDGSIIDNESYWISGRIYVGDSTSVICNTPIYKIAFYKSSDRLAEPTKSVTKNVVCPIPANTSYLVFQIEKANRSFEERESVIMSMGESLSKDGRYYKHLLEEDIAETSARMDKLPISLGYERTGQDFDFTNAINNKSIRSDDGSIIDNESYWISGRIYVGDSTSVICNTPIYKIAFYKSSDRLAEPTKSVAKNVVCPIPANTSYLVFQIEKANRSFEERKLVIMSMGESLSKESKYYKYSLEADILNTASKSMLIKDSLFDNFELGTLNSSNGQWDGGVNHTRATETLYIRLESIVSVSIDDAKHILIMGYDKAKKWTGTSTGWIESKKEFSREEISELFDDSKIEYVRFAFRKQSGGTITDLKDFYSGIVINYPLIDVQIEELQQKFAEPTQHTYYGEKIRLEQMLDYESIGNFIGQQGGCVYGDYLFRFNTDDTFRVYDIPTKSYIGAFTLDGGLKPHCNSAVFGNEKYNSSDEFPLLYVNAYNAPGLPKGTCYVHRIARSGNNFSTTLVQTIRIGFTDDPIWTNGSIDKRPYGNFAVDCDNSFLYVYTLRNEDNKTRFFKFALPKLSDGSTVTISKDAILEYWDCDFFPYIQDNHYYKGKLYLCTGYGNEYNGYIRVVDVIRKQEVSTINLNEIGLAIEPECIDIYDGHLICGISNIYKFTF